MFLHRLPPCLLFRTSEPGAEPMTHNIAKTVSQLITRIEDFSNMKFAAGGQLSEAEYYFWVVPISKLWETVSALMVNAVRMMAMTQAPMMRPKPASQPATSTA